jgi:hypothetical protein
MKNLPKLPDQVAKSYDCSIAPTTVTIQRGEAKGTYDLKTISLEDAAKLAKAGKYLTEKTPAKALQEKR